MRPRRRVLVGCAVLVPALWLSTHIPAPTRGTWLELTDTGTGRRITGRLLGDGEHVVLTWKNSLFGLLVTEVFAARDGTLMLNEITFADPSGREPPHVKVADVDDLYHTGGPFKATGLSRPFSRIVFRVGEIGNPALEVGGGVVHLAQEVGFGGAVLLLTRRPSLYEWALGATSPV